MTVQEFEKRYIYTANDHIGGGGFGEVYKAFDKEKGHYVAIKVSKVKPEFNGFTLEREVELAKEIPRHVNIAHYEACYRFDMGLTGVHDFAVLTYYEYGNLESFLQKNKHTLNDTDKQAILSGILTGIELLHDKGVVHRDIKASNILIHREHGIWMPKIADFGLSRAVALDISFSNSSMGISYHYAAPEQIENKKIRKNVDLWAYGVIVYRMMTGVLPFQAPSNFEHQSALTHIAEKITKRIFPPALQTIPEPYKTIIDRCWVADNAQRVQSAHELLPLLRGVNTTPPPPQPIVEQRRNNTATTQDIQAEPIDVTPVEAVDTPSFAKVLLGLFGCCLLAIFLLWQWSAQRAPLPAVIPNSIQPVVAPAKPAALPITVVVDTPIVKKEAKKIEPPIVPKKLRFTTKYGYAYTYTGSIVNGKADGKGVAKFDNQDIYEGDFLNNKMEGQGTYTWANGSKYVGGLKNESMHGYGTYYYSDNTRYEGNWYEHEKDGQGTFFYSDGARFLGYYKKGKLNGGSLLYDKNGSVIDRANWVDGKRGGVQRFYTKYREIPAVYEKVTETIMVKPQCNDGDRTIPGEYTSIVKQVLRTPISMAEEHKIISDYYIFHTASLIREEVIPAEYRSINKRDCNGNSGKEYMQVIPESKRYIITEATFYRVP